MLPKYRVWMNKEKAMARVLKIDYMDNKIAFAIDIFKDTPEVSCYKPYNVKFTEVELMKCSDIKDKNGVEIYEGDIVRTFSSLTGVVKYGEHKGDSKNLFHLGWYIDWIGDNNKALFSNHILAFVKIDSFDLEVIGNIYENPELLIKKEEKRHVF